MLDFIRQWSVNIVALVLFTVIIEILLPSGKMKKHVGLVTGTVLIITIITPLAGVLNKDFDFTKLHTSSSNSFDRLQIEKNSEYLEKMQMKQIVEVYRNKIISQMEDMAKEIKGVKEAKADIIFNEDYNSPDFGVIKRAYIEIKTVGDSSSKVGDSSSISTEPVRTVEVKVGNSAKGGKRNEEDEDVEPALKKKLEQKIADVFGMEHRDVIISKLKG